MKKIEALRKALLTCGQTNASIDQAMANASKGGWYPPVDADRELTPEEEEKFIQDMRERFTSTKKRFSPTGAKVRVFEGMTKIDITKQVAIAAGKSEADADSWIIQARLLGLVSPEMDAVVTPGTEQDEFDRQELYRLQCEHQMATDPLGCAISLAVKILAGQRPNESGEEQP